MYDFESRGKTPIFEYLCKCIKSDISSGKLSAGDKLVSKRRMAAQYGISVTSVKTAYEQLISEGYVVSYEKKGYFVSDIYDIPNTQIQSDSDRNRARYDEKTEELSPSQENSLFPFSVWSKLIRTVISEKGSKMLVRTPSSGVPELRCAISDYLYRSSGIEISPDRIIVGSGTEYLCSLIVTLLGRTKLYAFEDPGYKKIAYITSSSGAGIRFLVSDEGGVNKDELEKSGASVLHISPSNQYPTGNVIPAPRRYSLLSWLEKSDERYIIEDDYGSEIYLQGRKMPALFEIDRSGRVIYMNTFTKTISPSLRIGYLILPEKLCNKLKNELGFLSCTVSSIEQYTLARFISDGHFESYLSKQRTKYRQKLKTVAQSIENSNNIKIEYHGTGTNLVLKINKDIKEGDYGKIQSFVLQYRCLSMLNDYRKDALDNDATMILDLSRMNEDEERSLPQKLNTFIDGLFDK